MIWQSGATVNMLMIYYLGLKKSSHKLASIYVIGFVINLYLVFFISI